MKNKILKIFLICLIFTFNTSVATYSIPVWSDTDETVQVSAETTEQEGNFLNIESEAVILIEQSTGTVLYEKDSHTQLRPASVTKVMTILLIMEALDEGKISLEDEVPCSENASSMGGSQIWLDSTETLTVDEMLKAICVVSANDCIVQLGHECNG